jgi:hypothetical protein
VLFTVAGTGATAAGGAASVGAVWLWLLTASTARLLANNDKVAIRTIMTVPV